ncbi:MAG: DNA polymerase III subunit alpha [Turicibacter sp.]|nr:DNA polymerase III subunit alpha [Turicibacter sp.]
MLHLRVRSVYSILSSTITIKDYIQYALDRNLDTLSLIEEGGMHSAIKFYKACKKAGIKPIIGYSTGDLTLIAKNLAGYRGLLKIASQEATIESIQHYQADLVVIAPTPHPFDHFYLGICLDGPGTLEKARQVAVLSQKENIPLVALHDVRTLYKEDAETLRILTAIKNNELLGNTETSASGYSYLSPREMASLYKEFPEALDNISRLVEECHLDIPLGELLLPKFPVPGGDDSETYLKALCYRGLKKRFGSQMGDTHISRLEYELGLLSQMGFSDYFLICWDFIKFARQNQIAVGPGRGSAAGSLVAFVLGITNVDPIKYGLFFERFLNPERVSMPDIDIDFQDNRRDEVIQYVSEKYGARCVVQILTFGTFGSRSAWRDLARIHDIELKLINEVAAFIYSGSTLKSIYEQNAALREFFQGYPKLEAIYKEAIKIEGFPRHTSIHAAGVIISDRDLTDYTAIMEGPNGISLSQYEAEDLEGIGLLKMDFLGLKNLTMLEQIVAMIRQNDDPDFMLTHIPFDDNATYEMISQGLTTGIFQLESEGMRQVLKAVRPTEFEHIVACNALFRPGPMENIPLFAARKNGQKPVASYHPSLEAVLSKTYGILVYQEQIMQLAAIVAGYSLGEADVLRRAVSKKDESILKLEEERFVAGALRRGYDRQKAQELYGLILKFANYGFNRSHAVAYSVIAYQMAYLKQKYPAYFMAVSLTNATGSERATASYVKEARQLGLEVLPPSINFSGVDYRVEQGGIRFSLLPIKHIGLNLVNQLIEARKAGLFENFYDFVSRTRKFMNQRAYENLIDAGALSDFGHHQQTLHDNLLPILDFSKFDGGLFAMEFQIKTSPQDMPAQEKMQREKELLGFYLSTHPVAVLQSQIHEKGWHTPGSVQSLRDQRVICVGFVEKIRQIRDKKGNLMAFMDISDEQAVLSVTLFSSVYQPQFCSYVGRVLTIEGMLSTRKNEKNLALQKIIAIS